MAPAASGFTVTERDFINETDEAIEWHLVHHVIHPILTQWRCDPKNRKPCNVDEWYALEVRVFPNHFVQLGPGATWHVYVGNDQVNMMMEQIKGFSTIRGDDHGVPEVT